MTTYADKFLRNEPDKFPALCPVCHGKYCSIWKEANAEMKTILMKEYATDEPASGQFTAEPTDPAALDAMGTYNKPGAGIKKDEGKSQWHLLPLQYLDGVVRVLMRGAAKYSAHNWRRGMPWSQTYNATQRHLNAFMSGEDLDPESGQHHLDHALCELLFLRAHVQDYPAHDDRYKADVPMTATEIRARWEPLCRQDWQEWNGGMCPVKNDDSIVVKFRAGSQGHPIVAGANAMYWEHRGLAGDIVAWRYA